MTRSRRTTRAETATKVDLTKVPARVDRVKVSGLLRTHNDYVRQVAKQLFQANNFQEVMSEAMHARSYLQELGVFKDISVRVDVSHGENATPDGYEITFKGYEMSRLLGSMGTEIGQNEGSLRTELTIPNIFGRGESLSLQGAYSSRRANDLTLKFWKPFFHTRFMENRPEINFSLFRRTDRMDVSCFQNLNLGGAIEFAFETNFPFGLVHSLEYETSIRDLSLLNKKSVPFVIREHCGPKLASLLRHSVVYDERDNNVFPTKGFMIKTINEYCGGPLGGNLAYMSNTTHAEANVKLFAGLVAQICGRIGVVKETKYTSTLPISNFYYCGGPLTLRGFKYGGAGPVVDGTALGAQMYWSAGLHLWAPLPFSYVFKGLARNFRSHLFYNFGNFNTFSTDNLRSSVGLGIAFKLAERARLELNYCVPLRKYPSDRLTNGFQFGIGYEFV